MSHSRHYSPLDRLLIEAQRALSTTAGKAMAERVAWGGIAPGTALEKCALFPRVEA